MNFFSIKNIALSFLGYDMSWVELVATVFTIACVWLAAYQHILNWPVAIIAIILSFFVFYQSSLYADSFLQVYFLVTSIYGWWFWSKHQSNEAVKPVTVLTNKQRGIWAITVLIFTAVASYIMSHLNDWLPQFFPQPAAFPIPDSFIMVASIAGQWLLAKKKLENWYCWIVVDALAIVIYYLKDLKLFSLLYLILLLLATMGMISWKREVKD